MHHPLQQQQREQQQQPIESERNPLILPEIRRIVGQFLENKDILSLICVSHAFYLDFVPFLWSTLVFDSHLQKALTRKAFQEHGHSVRNLTLQAYDTVLECWQDAQCTNLRSLEILPTVNVLRRMTLEEFDESIADIEELDNEMDIEPTAKPKQGVMAVQRKIRSRLENRAFKLIDLIQHQRNLSILKLNWVTAFSGELLKRFYCFTNQLVALHLSKWTVELQDLNLLVRNSPCLREFFARGLSVEPTALDPSASNPTGFLDSTLTSSEISGVTLLGSKQQLQDQYSLHPILNFRQIRRLQFFNFTFKVSPLSIECPAAKSIQLSSDTFETLQEMKLRRGHTWNCPKLEKLEYTGQADETEVMNEYSERNSLSTILNTVLTPCSTRELAQDPSRQKSSTKNQELQKQHRGLRRIALTCCFEIGKNGSGLWARTQSLHGSTLEVINLSYSTGLTSMDIYSILASCERLRRFHGSEDYLDGLDLLKSTLGPWKCLRLERLHIRFQLTSSNREGVEENGDRRFLHRRPRMSPLTESQKKEVDAMYDQLSALKHLKVLDLFGFGSTDNCTRGIPFTLERGLGRLAGLTKMEMVHVTEWEAEMGEAEAEWIARHWSRLENIYMLYNNNDGEWDRFQGCLRKARQRVSYEKALYFLRRLNGRVE